MNARADRCAGWSWSHRAQTHRPAQAGRRCRRVFCNFLCGISPPRAVSYITIFFLLRRRAQFGLLEITLRCVVPPLRTRRHSAKRMTSQRQGSSRQAGPVGWDRGRHSIAGRGWVLFHDRWIARVSCGRSNRARALSRWWRDSSKERVAGGYYVYSVCVRAFFSPFFSLPVTMGMACKYAKPFNPQGVRSRYGRREFWVGSRWSSWVRDAVLVRCEIQPWLQSRQSCKDQ